MRNIPVKQGGSAFVRSRKSVFFAVIIFFGLSAESAFCSLQVSSDADRQAIMDQEMDCITKNFSGGEMTWDRSCTAQYSSRGYDVAKYNDAEKYSKPSLSSDQNSYNTDTYLDDGYQYSKYAVEDQDLDYPQEEVTYDPGDLRYSYKSDSASGRLLQVDLRLLGGWRMDDFDFNIASDITGMATPNILSELTWSDLKMTQLKLENDIVLADHFVFTGWASYADIYKGENQDSDYDGDNRTLEFSRSNNNSSDGEAMDWSLAAGYRIDLGSENEYLKADDIALTLLGGYSYHELNLIVTEGVQTIPATGSFGPTLHINYWAEWKGPWIGFNLEGSKDKIFGAFGFEYHWADYYGSANWNLRNTFQHPKSFEHIADGRGLVFNFGGGYHVTDSLTLDLKANFQDWETKKGIYRPFFSDGTSTDIQLNEVNWQSKSLMLGSTYLF
jgi:hypothetical protein